MTQQLAYGGGSQSQKSREILIEKKMKKIKGREFSAPKPSCKSVPNPRNQELSKMSGFTLKMNGR